MPKSTMPQFFNAMRPEPVAPNGTISRYLENTGVIPCETDSSNEASKSSQKSEKEVKLRYSEEYEIHTITEESEQVTQSDIKARTPSTFSSKAITPNKRYSSYTESGSSSYLNPTQKLSSQTNTMSQENSEYYKQQNIKPETVYEPKESNNNEEKTTMEGKDKYILDIVKKENMTNANMFTLTDKLKVILKNTSNNQKIKAMNSDSHSLSKSPILANENIHIKAEKVPTIKKGKLIKIKSPSKDGLKTSEKLYRSSSKVKYPSQTSGKLSQNQSIATMASSKTNKKASSNFLQRMEIDMKMRTYRDSSNKVKKPTKKKTDRKSKKISLKKIKSAVENTQVPNYQFDNDLRPANAFLTPNQSSTGEYLNTFTVESNPNELGSQKKSTRNTRQPVAPPHQPSALFLYQEATCVPTTRDKIWPAFPEKAKKRSKGSLSSRKLKHANTEVKLNNYAPEKKTPRPRKKPVVCLSQKKPKAQPCSDPKESLDLNLNTALQKLQRTNSEGVEVSKSSGRRRYAKSCCSTAEDNMYETSSSIISYKKNKYSKGRTPSGARKSPAKANVLCDISNKKPRDSELLSYLKDLQQSSAKKKGEERPLSYGATQENDKCLYSNKTSERETNEG